MMRVMRTKAVFSVLLATMLFVAAGLMASPPKVAPAGHEHTSARGIADQNHHAGHEHSHAAYGEEPGHQHQHPHDEDAPAGACASICCAAGMACCAALIVAPFDTRLSYERIRLHGPLGEVPPGTEPPVPLRPPRTAA